MSERTATRNRRLAMKKMREDMSPFQELRRRMIVGRPAEVEHSALSAVNAACVAADGLQRTIDDMKLEGTVFKVGIVAATPHGENQWKSCTQELPSNPVGIGELVSYLASLPDAKMVGLVFYVARPTTREWEMWTKPFLQRRDFVKILEIAVAKQADNLRSGGAN